MARTRISTTVDGDLLDRARSLARTRTDAELIDSALAALVDRHRRAELDLLYQEAYAREPLDTADEWGDLASFRDSAGAT